MKSNLIDGSISEKQQTQKPVSDLLADAFRTYPEFGLPNVRFDVASWEPVIEARKEYGLLERAPLEII